MPVTRSAKQVAKQAAERSKKAPTARSNSAIVPKKISFDIPPRVKEPSLIPPKLAFDFSAAKDHLCSVDARFNDVFTRLKCKPFQMLDAVDPFRSLVTSILGQQISWLAARSVTHKFIRLYDRSLPETLGPPQDSVDRAPEPSFPTAHQVAATDAAILRTAGLSGRKAEYVLDLASRFADGRLSAESLATASDEELAEMLIEVRGIGMWTVNMFSIFTMRRPNIMPVGDLGVQRGVLRWFLSWHNPMTASSPAKLSPKKLPRAKATDTADKPSQSDLSQTSADIEKTSPVERAKTPRPVENKAPDVSSVPPAQIPSTPRKLPMSGDSIIPLPSLPEPFTPSINRTLNGQVSHLDLGDNETRKTTPAPALPEGLTLTTMKARLAGSKIKGALLTPEEMEALTECWKPYRSIGVYYMWALAEDS